MLRSMLAGVAAATITYLGLGCTDTAAAQQVTRAPTTVAPTPRGPIIVAQTIDLRPIPSRIRHGAVSIRNTGTAASAPSIVTVVCHLPGQEGGCGPDLPDDLMADYEDAAYPNAVVVQIPAIAPGHVHTHYLTFWNEIDWATGAYQFDFVADASATNNESNEANNTGSYVWNVP